MFELEVFEGHSVLRAGSLWDPEEYVWDYKEECERQAGPAEGLNKQYVKQDWRKPRGAKKG